MVRPKLKSKMVSLSVVPAQWKEFGKLVQSEGQTLSGRIRQLVAADLRRAAKERATA